MEKFIKEITRQAGLLTFRKFGKVGVKYTKAHALDVVTEADLAANKIIIEGIKKKFPKHGIISEETGEFQKDAEFVWIIDPIDGTLNFSRKIPLYAVLVALKKGNSLEMACAYNPVLDELYFAKRGKGAFINGVRIYCSKQKTLAGSVGCISDSMKGEKLPFLNKLVKSLKGERCGVGSFYSIGICGMFAADGRKDWFVSTGSGNIWDFAAPVLIAKEAGCMVTNLEGKPWQFSEKQMVVANKVLNKEIVKLLAGK